MIKSSEILKMSGSLDAQAAKAIAGALNRGTVLGRRPSLRTRMARYALSSELAGTSNRRAVRKFVNNLRTAFVKGMPVSEHQARRGVWKSWVDAKYPGSHNIKPIINKPVRQAKLLKTQ